MLPTTHLGGYPVSRLIIGGNPFSGNSHVSREMDEEMQDFFTTERIKRTLYQCMEHGINAVQLRADKHIMRILREFRQEGGVLHWIAQTAPEYGDFLGNVRQAMQYAPIAIYHHGTVTDGLYKQGEMEELKRRLRVLRETGKAVGLGTHMPEVIQRAEEERWDVDFYMASVHNLSHIDRESSAVTGIANADEPFFDADRPLMYRAIRGTDKPCLAFKILGATRRCQSQQTVRDAFEEAYASIKPVDAVVVGVYPRDVDQVALNSGYARGAMRG